MYAPLVVYVHIKLIFIYDCTYIQMFVCIYTYADICMYFTYTYRALYEVAILLLVKSLCTFSAQFTEVYRFSTITGSQDSLTYTLATSDSVFSSFFLIDGRNGAVYLQQPLAGRNITSTTGTVKV